MGTDIFAYIETQFEGSWWGLHMDDEDLDLDRSYVVFSKMTNLGCPAGVAPIVPERGLPPDLSTAVEAQWRDLMAESGMHPSWLTADEWEQALVAAVGEAWRESHADHAAGIDAMRALDRPARLVFWLDG